MTLKAILLLIIKIFIGILFVGGAIFNLYELDLSAHPEMVIGTSLAILVSFGIGGFLFWSSYKDLKNSKNVLKNVAGNIGSTPRIIFLAIVTIFIVLGLFVPGGLLTKKYVMTCGSGNPYEHLKLVTSPFSSRFFIRSDTGWSEIKNGRSMKRIRVVEINNGAVLFKTFARGKGEYAADNILSYASHFYRVYDFITLEARYKIGHRNDGKWNLDDENWDFDIIPESKDWGQFKGNHKCKPL